MLVRGPLGKDSGADQCVVLLVTGLGAACFKLQSAAQIVAASAGPECVWGGPGCAPRPASPKTES